MSDEPKVKRVVSAEARANMSAAARKRKPMSAEHKANIGAGNRGKVRSAEVRAKMRARGPWKQHRRPGRLYSAVTWGGWGEYDDAVD